MGLGCVRELLLMGVILPGMGAAYGTAKSGIGIAGVGTFRPDLIMKVRPPNAASNIRKTKG
jgi:hypothetical protein